MEKSPGPRGVTEKLARLAGWSVRARVLAFAASARLLLLTDWASGDYSMLRGLGFGVNYPRNHPGLVYAEAEEEIGT